MKLEESKNKDKHKKSKPQKLINIDNYHKMIL